MMPLTRSMVQGMRSAAMNLARSLEWRRGEGVSGYTGKMVGEELREGGEREEEVGKAKSSPIQKVHGNAKVFGHTPQSNNTIALQQLLIPTQAHLAHKPSFMLVEIAILT